MFRSKALLFLAGFSAVVGGFGTGWLALTLLSADAPAPRAAAPVSAPAARPASPEPARMAPAPSPPPAAKPETVRPGPTRIADGPPAAVPARPAKAAPTVRKPDTIRVRLPFGEFDLDW